MCRPQTGEKGGRVSIKEPWPETLATSTGFPPFGGETSAGVWGPGCWGWTLRHWWDWNFLQVFLPDKVPRGSVFIFKMLSFIIVWSFSRIQLFSTPMVSVNLGTEISLLFVMIKNSNVHWFKKKSSSRNDWDGWFSAASATLLLRRGAHRTESWGFSTVCVCLFLHLNVIQLWQISTEYPLCPRCCCWDFCFSVYGSPPLNSGTCPVLATVMRNLKSAYTPPVFRSIAVTEVC